MSENELSRIIVNSCLQIHKTLGPGLYESVYEEILSYELIKTGLELCRQKAIPVTWDDLIMEQGFRADLIIENNRNSYQYFQVRYLQLYVVVLRLHLCVYKFLFLCYYIYYQCILNVHHPNQIQLLYHYPYRLLHDSNDFQLPF